MEQAQEIATTKALITDTAISGKKKLLYITKLQSFAIVLVVLGHCTPTNNWQLVPASMNWLIRFIYSFHLPLFMFVSGFLFIYSTRGKTINYKEFVTSKFKRLIIPYLVVGTVAFILKIIFSEYALRKVSFTLNSYLSGIFIPIENPMINLWFLPTLFLVFLVAPLFKKVIESNNKAAVILLGIMLGLINNLELTKETFLNISGVLSFLIYFFLGCIVAFYDEIVTFIAKYAFIVVLLSGLLLISSMGLKYSFIKAVIGIVFSFALSHQLVHIKKGFLSYIDGYYYQIFLLSWFVQVSFRTLYRMEILDYWLTVVVMLIGGLYLPVIISKIVQVKVPRVKIALGLQ